MVRRAPFLFLLLCALAVGAHADGQRATVVPKRVRWVNGSSLTSISTTYPCTVTTADIVSEPINVANTSVQSVMATITPTSTTDVVVIVQGGPTAQGPWESRYNSEVYVFNLNEQSSAVDGDGWVALSMPCAPWIRFTFVHDSANRAYAISKFEVYTW